MEREKHEREKPESLKQERKKPESLKAGTGKAESLKAGTGKAESLEAGTRKAAGIFKSRSEKSRGPQEKPRSAGKALKYSWDANLATHVLFCFARRLEEKFSSNGE